MQSVHSPAEAQVVMVTCSDPDARQICEICLRHAGYVIVTVGDADRALDVARRVRPQLIVTSHPTWTSTRSTVTETVRAVGTFAETPILSLASWVGSDDLARAREAGVTESLLMPTPLHALLDAVRRLIGPAPPSAPHGTADVALTVSGRAPSEGGTSGPAAP